MLKQMMVVLAALILFAGGTLPAMATEKQGDSKAAAVRELMELMRAAELADQFGQAMTQQLYQVLKTTRPELPPEAFEIVREEVGRQLAEDRDKLLGQMAAIYEKNFAEQEMRDLIAFYQSDLGRRTMAVIPQIIQESMGLGKSWGQAVGPKLMARLEERFKKSKGGGGK